MDIQFSGAVDHSPLFNTMNQYGPAAAEKMGRPSYKDRLLEDQKNLLEPLKEDSSIHELEEADTRPSLNVWA